MGIVLFEKLIAWFWRLKWVWDWDDDADGGVRKDGEENHQSIHTSAQSLSPSRTSQNPQPEETKTQTSKKKKKGKPSTTGWNRSKRCEITPTHTQIRCVKQLKCIKYLRISVKKLKKEVGRRSVPLAREERRDRDPAARVAWAGDRWLRAWMGEGRQRLLRKCGGTGMKMDSDLLYVKESRWRDFPKAAPGVTMLWPWDLCICVYLPKCRKFSFDNLNNLKYDFSFYGSSHKN